MDDRQMSPQQTGTDTVCCNNAVLIGQLLKQHCMHYVYDWFTCDGGGLA